MTSVLAAQALGKKYGKRWALRDCTIDIPTGHVVGLVGPNGAGKTTLLKLASGQLEPTAGDISVLGGRPAGTPAQLAKVDHEQDILDLARRWANDRRFQVGVQQLQAIVRPAEAGVAYSDIAAATISALCDRVEQRFAETHGGFRGQRLAVLGMGKLGSREMSATSDLDLIFVYDIPSDLEASDGRQPLPPTQYYTRLSAKIVTALTAHTNEGGLYEVDMRLRPSGRAGPLAN